MPATVTTRRFNLEEYRRMPEAGVLHPAERVELVEGEIFTRLLVGGIEDRGTVRVQNPSD